jgi:hypothetical protein
MAMSIALVSKTQSAGESKTAFSDVINFYNLAGEQSDIKSNLLSKNAIQSVEKK